MKALRHPREAERRQARAGFTLLELLVALVILLSAFAVIWSTFSTTLRAWERGRAYLDEMHNGDFVMEQLVQGLRSAAFFPASPDIYGFWLEASGGTYPKDEMSWVTSGTTFLPPDSPLANGLYRLSITIDDNDDGDPSVAVTAYPHMADPEELDLDPWYISTKVKGLACEVYNFEEETWDDVWEDTNAIPSLVKVSLYMEPVEKYGKPVIMRRLVEIPMGPAVTSAVAAVEAAPVEEEAGTEAQPARGTAQPTAGSPAPSGTQAAPPGGGARP